MSFNIRSLSKNGHSFAPYIDGLNKKPDVIVLSETWFRPEKIGNIPGYRSFNSVRTEMRAGHGGVSVFCRNDLSLKLIEVSNVNTEIIEYVHVKLISKGINDNKNINIIGIYREPSHGVRGRFITEVEQLTNALPSTELNVLCGDLNFDLINPDNLGNYFVDVMVSASLEQHITLPTRIYNSS